MEGELTIDGVAGMLSPLDISWKELMGEYRLYLNGAQFGLLSEGRLLLAVTSASKDALGGAEVVSSYGSPDMISAEGVDPATLVELIPRMCEELPKRKACRLYRCVLRNCLIREPILRHDTMDRQFREYLLMAAVAIVMSLAITAVAWMLWADDFTREISAVAAIVIGSVAGLIMLLLLRRRDPFHVPAGGVCGKTRSIAAIISLLALVPAAVSLLAAVCFPDFGQNDFSVISAIMVFVSMLVQAVFWRKAQAIGYLTTINVYMLILLLILMNVGSILAIDSGGVLMTAVAMIAMVIPILLLFDWSWSVDAALIGSAVCLVCAIAGYILQGEVSPGPVIVFLVPPLFLLVMRGRMKGTRILADGEILF